ncbi:MAG: NUDIX hydrolase [Nanoarchaeota archaeon]
MALNEEGNFEKIKDTGRAVFLVIFNESNSKILLLKRNIQKRNFWKVSWGNVGGKVDPGECSKDAILRESLEEVGVKFNGDNLKLLHIKEIPHAKENWHPVHFFYGISIKEDEEIKVNKESDSHSWFCLNELPEDMFDSKEFILSLKSKFLEKDLS